MTENENKIDQLTQCIGGLVEEIKQLKAQMKYSSKPCYSNTEVQDIFNINRATLKKWRDEGWLSYSQIGSIYQYSQEDIQNCLKNHHISY